MGKNSFLQRLATQEDGQGLTEYSLMLGFVILGIWVLISMSGLGDNVTRLFSHVAEQLSDV
jgi:Flp pilus assembly pilin Flp